MPNPCSKNTGYFFSLCLCSSFSVAGWAVEGQWIPSASLNYRDLSYSAGLTDVSTTLWSAGVGLTLTQDRWYLDTSFETDLSSDNDNPGLDFSRKDVTASIGYGLSDTISTFVGYKYGRTRIEFTNLIGAPISLTSKGFFIGAGAGVPFEQYGVFFFSAAYANLEATYQDDSVAGANGNATGTSLSAGWRGRIDEHWNYEFVLVRHDYYHEDFVDLSLDINENILSLNAGISYKF